ncbi:hypothetical protein BHE74_00019912 [Ensete ventricosum]|nr:hypothetical protein BHE74_00019912 [Ensete ventricosum]
MCSHRLLALPRSLGVAKIATARSREKKVRQGVHVDEGDASRFFGSSSSPTNPPTMIEATYGVRSRDAGSDQRQKKQKIGTHKVLEGALAREAAAQKGGCSGEAFWGSRDEGSTIGSIRTKGVNDVGRVISSIGDEISELQSQVVDLKVGVTPEGIAAAEQRAPKMGAKVVQTKSKLEESKRCLEETQRLLKESHGKVWSMEDQLLKLSQDVAKAQSKAEKVEEALAEETRAALEKARKAVMSTRSRGVLARTPVVEANDI